MKKSELIKLIAEEYDKAITELNFNYNSKYITEIGRMVFNINGEDALLIVAYISNQKKLSSHPETETEKNISANIRAIGKGFGDMQLYTEWFADQESAIKKLQKVFTTIKQQKRLA